MTKSNYSKGFVFNKKQQMKYANNIIQREEIRNFEKYLTYLKCKFGELIIDHLLSQAVDPKGNIDYEDPNNLWVAFTIVDGKLTFKEQSNAQSLDEVYDLCPEEILGDVRFRVPLLQKVNSLRDFANGGYRSVQQIRYLERKKKRTV